MHFEKLISLNCRSDVSVIKMYTFSFIFFLFKSVVKPFMDGELSIGVASYAIALNPSNKITAVGDTGGKLHIFDTQTGEEIQQIQVGTGLKKNLRSLKYNNGKKFHFVNKKFLV